MEMVTKNIGKGEPINDLRELVRLANEKKSIIVYGGWGCYVRPAAFMINWSLGQLAKMRFFYSININK
jgi:hypothetical protein